MPKFEGPSPQPEQYPQTQDQLSDPAYGPKTLNEIVAWVDGHLTLQTIGENIAGSDTQAKTDRLYQLGRREREIYAQSKYADRSVLNKLKTKLHSDYQETRRVVENTAAARRIALRQALLGPRPHKERPATPTLSTSSESLPSPHLYAKEFTNLILAKEDKNLIEDDQGKKHKSEGWIAPIETWDELTVLDPEVIRITDPVQKREIECLKVEARHGFKTYIGYIDKNLLTDQSL